MNTQYKTITTQYNFINLYDKKNNNKVLEFENFGKVWVCWVYENNEFVDVQTEFSNEEMEELFERMQESSLHYIDKY